MKTSHLNKKCIKEEREVKAGLIFTIEVGSKAEICQTVETDSPDNLIEVDLCRDKIL